MCLGSQPRGRSSGEPIGFWRQVEPHLGLGTYQHRPGHSVKDTGNFRSLMKIQHLELLLKKKKKKPHKEKKRKLLFTHMR